MNNANNAPVAPVNPPDAPVVTPETKKKRGRTPGWCAAFKVNVRDIEPYMVKLGLNNIRVSSITERKRTPEEVMELFMASTSEQKTDPNYLASLVTEKTESGVTLKELTQKVGINGTVKVSRADIVALFDRLKAQAINVFDENNITEDED